MTNHRVLRYTLSGLLMLLCVVGCDVVLPDETPPEATPVSVRVGAIVTNTPQTEPDGTPIPTLTPTETPPPTATPMPFDLESAITVMNGLCFESVADAAGRVFIMRSAEEHINLYDLAENSGLCRRPIIRNPFDFSNGRILVGTWTYGIGCTADHTIRNVVRDDEQQTITIDLQFMTFGDCPYELVRPFWVAFDNATNHEVIINVEQPAS